MEHEVAQEHIALPTYGLSQSAVWNEDPEQEEGGKPKEEQTERALGVVAKSSFTCHEPTQ